MTALVLDDVQWVSLCSGYGGLDEGVLAVTGGGLAAVAEWEPPHVDKKTGKVTPSKQAPARILAHHFPNIPNLGNLTEIDWTPWAGRISGVTAGFPCQDVSSAGLRNGMLAGNRSGLWYEVARAILELSPLIVVIENVPGLRSARAGDPMEATGEEDRGLELGDGTVGDPVGGDAGHLRGGAFRAILRDLAALGFYVEWVSVRASDVGAPHRRERVFLMAVHHSVDRIARRPAPVPDLVGR